MTETRYTIETRERTPQSGAIPEIKMRAARLLLTFGLLLVALGGFAQSPKEAIDRFAASRGITPGSTAVLITDLSNGQEIVAYNDSRSLMPASIMKSVTAASLLEKGGADRRWETKVYIDGPVDRGGVLDGNLVIVGSGDPALGTDREPLDGDFIGEILAALKEKKITGIKGQVIIDDSYFTGPAVPPSWASGDLSTYYGTGVHGFNFERNASGKKSISNPAGVFTSRLKSRLALAGINIGGEKTGGHKKNLLVTHRSPSFEDVMRSCMMRSDNMYAESMLRTFGRLSGGEGDVAGSAVLETEFWKRKRAPLEGVSIVDGSGLSRQNRVTARFMDYVLSAMKDNVEYASFFPLAGQEGTLKNFLAGTELEAYVAMKTGSMNGIQCYAGYVLDDDFAPTHSVVFIMNSLKDRTAARRSAEQLLLDLFAKSPAAAAAEGAALGDDTAPED